VKAKVRGATLENAKLAYADFSHADLTSACCRGADFTGANLHAVIKGEADMTGAVLEGTKTTDEKRLHAEAWRPPP
jgi:uncharacterized protein YjbI with pentapeptide repeats